MSYHERLVGEINAKLDELAERREQWDAPWIAHAICQAHTGGLAENDDADFWRHGGYHTTRKLVTEVINRRAGGSATPAQRRQLALPGFAREHLQDYYVIERDGKERGICVLDLTDAEIDAKVALYRAIGTTSHAHANELERFKAWRHEQPPVDADQEKAPAEPA